MDVDNTDEDVSNMSSATATTTSGEDKRAAGSNLPRPGALHAGCEHDKPNLLLKFNDVSLHRDVFALLRHGTLRMGSMNPADKKKVALLWRSFVQPMMGFSPDVLDDHYAISIANAKPHKKEPVNRGGLAIGKRVKTAYGDGVVQGGRASRMGALIEVMLPFGRAFMHIDGVTPLEGTEKDDDDEASMDVDGGSSSEGPEGDSMTISSDELAKAQKMAGKASSRPKRRSFYGSNSWYFFVRLYHILYDRIGKAKQLCSEQRRSSRNFVLHPIEQIKSGEWRTEHSGNSAADYSMFLTSVCNLLDGTIGTTRYEEILQESMGSGSFLLFTVDKVVQSALKQLHTLACNEKCAPQIDLSLSQGIKASYDSNEAHRMAASQLLEEQEEDCYRVDIQDGTPANEGESSASGDLYPELQKEKEKAGLPPKLPDDLGPKHGWREAPQVMVWYKPFAAERRPKSKEKKDDSSAEKSSANNGTGRNHSSEKVGGNGGGEGDEALLKFGSKPTGASKDSSSSSSTSMDVDAAEADRKKVHEKREEPKPAPTSRRPRRGAAVQAAAPGILRHMLRLRA